jgi:hypothetical protein
LVQNLNNLLHRYIVLHHACPNLVRKSHIVDVKRVRQWLFVLKDLIQESLELWPRGGLWELQLSACNNTAMDARLHARLAFRTRIVVWEGLGTCFVAVIANKLHCDDVGRGGIQARSLGCWLNDLDRHCTHNGFGNTDNLLEVDSVYRTHRLSFATLCRTIQTAWTYQWRGCGLRATITQHVRQEKLDGEGILVFAAVVKRYELGGSEEELD